MTSVVSGSQFLCVLCNILGKSLPSGKLRVCYGKLPIEIDGLPIKNGDVL
jgi:hypothetical protein